MSIWFWAFLDVNLSDDSEYSMFDNTMENDQNLQCFKLELKTKVGLCAYVIFYV